MVPSAFVALPEFPRLPNGKLDRSALPAPERASGSEDAAFTPPVTGLQQTIAEIFRNLLGVERVGLDQNFFDLGAHSLQIVKAHSELNRSLEKKIMLVALFQHPTIRSLAEYMERENHAHTTDAYSSGGNTLPVGAR
jgi:acyl carrier protein